jgi:hypothetical protein
MAADLPEYYEGHPAFQFIKDVAVDWEKSLVLEGEIGKYITMARQQRGSDNWFVGAITGKEKKETTLKLDFLDEGKEYDAIIYSDSKDAHWQTNPTSYSIEKIMVDKNTQITLTLSCGGGAAISILAVN